MRVLALGLLTALLPAFAQPSPDGYVSADRPYATIYAPTEADLHNAVEEVSYAALQFERAFGEAPPPITVLVTAHPQDAVTLPDDGRPVLRFWTEDGMSTSGPDAVLVGGALLREVGGEVRVVGLAMGQETPFQPGDVVVAVDGTPVGSMAAWRDALPTGAARPVAVTVRRDGAETTVEVEASARPSNGTAQARQRPLSHEAGHLFLVAYSRGKGTRPEGEDRVFSGVPALPDWMDEGFATWCEIPSVVRVRDALLGRQRDALIPTDSLLAMDHPLVASGLLDGLSTDDRTPGSPIRVAAAGRAATTLRLSGLFYAQSSSLTRYLAAAHGPRVFGRLVDRVLGGASTTEALADEGVDPATLDADWRTWTTATVAMR